MAVLLHAFCDTNNIIPDRPFGFCSNSSCEQAILSAVDIWSEAVDARKYAGALLLDFSKAFDCVPRQMLINELASIGVSADPCDWLISYLSERRQAVRTDLSEPTVPWKVVNRDVPQGSCLSPLLFNMLSGSCPLVVGGSYPIR